MQKFRIRFNKVDVVTPTGKVKYRETTKDIYALDKDDALRRFKVDHKNKVNKVTKIKR